MFLASEPLSYVVETRETLGLLGSGLARPRRKLASSARFRELLSQTPRLAFSRTMLARRVEIRSAPQVAG